MNEGETKDAWRAIAAFDAFLLAVAILASRADMFVHEVVGHVLPEAVLGSKISGVDLTLFGGGLAHCFFPRETGDTARALCFAGGSIANVVTGAVALVLARRAKSAPLAIFCACFGTASVISSFTYTAKGLYYGFGDAARVVGALYGEAAEQKLALGSGRSWIVVTLAVPIVSALAMCVYVPLQDRFFPPVSWRSRIRTAALTLGIVAVAYGGLYLAADRFVAPQDPARLGVQWDGARLQAAREARTKALLDELRARRPGVPDNILVKELIEELRRNPVAPSAVPRTIPLAWILPLLVALGSGWAIFRQAHVRGSRLRIDSTTLGYTALGAGMVLLALFMLGQRIPITFAGKGSSEFSAGSRR